MHEETNSLPPLFQVPPRVARLTAGQRLRTYFLTGLVVAGPLTITAYITWSFIKWVDGLIKPLVPSAYWPDRFFAFEVPGLGLLVALVGVTLLGFLTANLVGRSLLDLSETVLGRMPVIRGLYKSMKQIFMTVFNEEGSSFRLYFMLFAVYAQSYNRFLFLSAQKSGDRGGYENRRCRQAHHVGGDDPA